MASRANLIQATIKSIGVNPDKWVFHNGGARGLLALAHKKSHLSVDTVGTLRHREDMLVSTDQALKAAFDAHPAVVELRREAAAARATRYDEFIAALE